MPRRYLAGRSKPTSLSTISRALPGAKVSSDSCMFAAAVASDNWGPKNPALQALGAIRLGRSPDRARPGSLAPSGGRRAVTKQSCFTRRRSIHASKQDRAGWDPQLLTNDLRRIIVRRSWLDPNLDKQSVVRVAV